MTRPAMLTCSACTISVSRPSSGSSSASPNVFYPEYPEPRGKEMDPRRLPVAVLPGNDLLARPPQGGGGDLRGVAAVGVLAGYLGDLLQQSFAQGGRLQAEVQEAVVADVQIVLVGLVARVLHVVYLRARAVGDQPGKVAQTVGFGHLVVDVDAVAPLGRVLQGELYAAHGVLDVDESAGLAARAVDGERVAYGGLHEEAIEDSAVVAVVVAAVWVPHTMPWCRSVTRVRSFLL